MNQPSRRNATSRRRTLGIAAVTVCCALVLTLVGIIVSERATPRAKPSDARSVHQVAATPALPSTTTVICGRAILHSPYHYNGAAGSYRSGIAGLPTYGTPHSDFPNDTTGMVLPAQTQNYENWQLKPDTVYYLKPGLHIGSFAANTNDAFVGGYAGRVGTTLSGNYAGYPWAVASNSAIDVTIEYLTIEKYQPVVNQVAINQGGDTGWILQYNTITLNVPGGGAFAGTDNVVRDNCMTLNGQYGFQSSAAENIDSLTQGPYNVIIEDNEISYNDTCDLSGLLNNAVIGWHNHNPVPAKYRNPKCGTVTGDGDQGGFKLWATDGVTVRNNYIHNNWGPGGWADTDNANTTWTGNVITDNESVAIVEEISYNFSITNNYIADNDWIDGLANPRFPQTAIYISESGSDRTFGGVPACPEPACAGQGSYPDQSVILENTLVDNGGNIFLWQDSNRYCGDGSDGVCTLVDSRTSSPFTMATCKANLRSAAISTTTYAGERTGSPLQDWWDGCIWKTENVEVSHNTIEFNPAHIMDCTHAAWPDCGAGGIFSEYGGAAGPGGWVVPTELTFFQNDVWSNNVYEGPSTFFAWNQGNGDNPVSWADWTGRLARGNECSSAGERQSGFCIGPFGQDAGSTFTKSPPA